MLRGTKAGGTPAALEEGGNMKSTYERTVIEREREREGGQVVGRETQLFHVSLARSTVVLFPSVFHHSSLSRSLSLYIYLSLSA